MLVAAVSLLASTAYGQQSVQDPLVRWLTEQKTAVESRIQRYREQEARAQQALGQAQQAQSLADQLHDPAAGQVAQRAVTVANDALAKVRALRARDEEQLAAIQRAAGWRTVPHLETATPAQRERQGQAPREFWAVSLTRGELLKKAPNGWVHFDGLSPLLPGDEVQTGRVSDVACESIGPRLHVHVFGEPSLTRKRPLTVPQRSRSSMVLSNSLTMAVR